ncbi:MAG: SAM-dependent methyltransferase [Actinomycetota bacterium]|nr:SAM-dependent methyltransferase [Actinomycetota bacterium]
MDTTSRAFFDDKYRRDEDPWGFTSEPYELARYDHLVDLLGDRRFDRGFEPGCSIGVLTRTLAPRCRRLLAIDISPIAVRRAQQRCSDLPGVEIRTGALPRDLPDDATDLVVLSEVGYYLTADVLATTVDALVDLLPADGVLLGGHWTGSSPDHLLSGQAVHDIIDAHPGLRLDRHDVGPGYLVGAWRRR